MNRDVNEHLPYCVIYDGGNFIDGIERNSLDEAISTMKSIYESWADEGTIYTVEEWNEMIDSCCCYVVEWNADKQEYGDCDTAYFLSDEELELIGWVEREI